VARGTPLDVLGELLQALDHCFQVTHYLVGAVPVKLWHVSPPSDRGRTIAGIVAHIQSVRRTFAKMGGARPVPPSLDRRTSTPTAARRALQDSHEALMHVLGASLERGDARIKGLPRRTVNMIVYLVQHDAHHRGQIVTLAKDLGHEFTGDDVMKIWGWKKL
jgi:uncharacterized damage-inducible protein DinB